MSLHEARTIEIEEQLSTDSDFSATLGKLWEKIIRDIERIALDGKASEFEEWVSVVRVLPFNQEQTRLKLEAWYQDVARYSEPIQASLRALLDMSVPVSEGPEIIVDQQESVQTTQLASR